MPKQLATIDSEKELRLLLNLPFAAYNELLSQSQDTIAKFRIEINLITEILSDAEKLQQAQKELAFEEITKHIGELENNLESTKKELKESEKLLETLEIEVLKESEVEPKIIAMGTLYEIGKQAGLRDGKCPLCGTD